MATATVTIASASNPTYGGCVDFDGTSTYVRTVLSAGAPTVNFATPNIKRSFALFDLSTDPTGGGTISKVELLATVSSVSGTPAVDIQAWDLAEDIGAPLNPADYTDDYLYSLTKSHSDNVAAATYSAGAQTIDLSQVEAPGAHAIDILNTAIASQVGLGIGISLSNEAAAGSVVFDAAVGFGLRLTYTGGAGDGPTTASKSGRSAATIAMGVI